MVVLVYTNIIIDALANREPYADNAKKILEKCAAREVTGILAGIVYLICSIFLGKTLVRMKEDFF